MDPLTHTLCGAAIGAGFFRGRLGPRAPWICAAAANLPDLDAIVVMSGDPGAIFLRRSFGHSVLLLPLWAAGMAWLARRSTGLGWGALLAAIGINCGAHLALDLLNSFGVQLLWPLTTRRWEWATNFVIDLPLTAILAAMHLARLRPPGRPGPAWSARAALLSAGLYVLASYGLRRESDQLLATAAPLSSFRYVFPEPLGVHRWKGVARTREGWEVYRLRPLSGEVSRAASVLSEDEAPAVRRAKALPEARKLEPFLLAPVWRTAKSADGNIVTAYDLRFPSLTVPRGNIFDFVFYLPD